jgi:hypothetical protein
VRSHLTDVVPLHLIATEAKIHDNALFSYAPKTTKSNHLDTYRITTLTTILHSAEAWFDIFLTIPPATLADFGFLILTQLSYFCVAVYRLATLDEPDWDRHTVLDTVDLLRVLDDLEQRFARVASDAGLISDRPDGDIFTKSVKAIGSLRVAWGVAIAGSTATSGDGATSRGQDVTMVPAGEGLDPVILEEFSTEFAEGFNGWLTDMFTPWEGLDR